MIASLLTVTTLTILGIITCGVNNPQYAEKKPAPHTPHTGIHVANS